MRVFILDDHAVFRVGLKSVLSSSDEWQVVGEAASAREAFPLIDTTQPELVILDLVLPGMDGCVAARELRRRIPEARLVMLTVCESAYDVLEAFDAGASGYVLKSDSLPSLLESLRQVARGEQYVAGRLAPLLHADRRQSSQVLTALSEREREVFRLAADGLVNGQIAFELCISRKTVETHKYRIQKKIGLRTPADLLRFAALHGMIRGPHSIPEGPERG